MDLSQLYTSLQNTIGMELPSMLAAVGILIIGYIIAVVARAATLKLLNLVRLNKLTEDSIGRSTNVAKVVSLAVFWFILLLTLIAIFETLNLNEISSPLSDVFAKITNYLPNLIAGVLLVFAAWLLGTIIRSIVNKALSATKWDEKLAQQAQMAPLGEKVGNILFWLIILLFLPAILAALRINGMLGPVRNMLDIMLAMLPNIFAAGLIIFAGWLLASVLRGLVVNLLTSFDTDKLGSAVGIGEVIKLSKLAGTLVFILVLIPALIAALDALHIQSISEPATRMLSMILDAVPNILAAALILALTWYVARIATSLIARLLANLGFDSLPNKIGMEQVFSKEYQPSDFVGKVILFFAMLFAIAEAAHRLNFITVEQLLGRLIQFSADVALGLVILAIGFWLASIAHRVVLRSNKNAVGIAAITRYVILAIIIAMGLNAMGVANSIVNMAFAITFGAIGVAVAIAFGLGGREAAGRQMEHWLKKLRNKSK